MYEVRSNLATIEEPLVECAAASDLIKLLDKLADDSKANRDAHAKAMQDASELAKQATEAHKAALNR